MFLFSLDYPLVCCCSWPHNIRSHRLHKEHSVVASLNTLHIVGRNGFIVWVDLITVACFQALFTASVLQ